MKAKKSLPQSSSDLSLRTLESFASLQRTSATLIICRSVFCYSW